MAYTQKQTKEGVALKSDGAGDGKRGQQRGAEKLDGAQSNQRGAKRNRRQNNRRNKTWQMDKRARAERVQRGLNGRGTDRNPTKYRNHKSATARKKYHKDGQTALSRKCYTL